MVPKMKAQRVKNTGQVWGGRNLYAINCTIMHEKRRKEKNPKAG
jgi:hypothetical protein